MAQVNITQPVAVQHRDIREYFPLANPRDKQLRALDFIQRAYEAGYRDIVISAPTGTGKSAIGIAACYWSDDLQIPGYGGGYYLVTQKMLQDQLERDVSVGAFNGTSLKSATEYPCAAAKVCALGMQSAKLKKGRCRALEEGNCSYQLQKQSFLASKLAITNYSYFLTEKIYVGKFPQRKVVVADECHNLEKNLISFYDLVISEDLLDEWAPRIKNIPQFSTKREALTWIEKVYMSAVDARLEELTLMAEESERYGKEAMKLEQHISKTKRAWDLIMKDPKDWVFWQERNRNQKLELIVRPMYASAFMPAFVDSGTIRIYMSAYPGSKNIFCRTLGLDRERVAWLSLNSPFAPTNRPVIMSMVGSMSKRNVAETMPKFLRLTEKILDKHHSEKGIIHCNSYAIGKAISDHFRNTKHASRILFPTKADEREKMFVEHAASPSPTVIVSPSMTEGFDFKDELATWQIIAKVPYPSLSDRQIVAKKDADPDWYTLQAVSTIIQATGRICRNESDHGTTYILDRDFMGLWERGGQEMFPKWYTEAMVWRKS